MTAPLKLLVIEDDSADFLLITRHLRACGLSAACTRVTGALELAAALESGPWDAVLADYYLNGMEFTEVLDQVRGRWPDLPLILVSAAVGEERAVDLLRDGVADLVLKEHLSRLGPTVGRCLQEAAERRARAAAEVAMRESEDRLRLALDGGELGMWDLKVPTDALVVNARWAAILGARLADILPTRVAWEARTHPEDLPGLREGFAALIEGRLPLLECEHRLRHQTGHWVWVAARGKVIARDAQGRAARLCGTLRDLSEVRRLTHELRQLTDTDPLTGVVNRRYLMRILDRETLRVQRYGRALSLVLFDLDRFRTVNETQGQERGDAVLAAVAAQVGRRLRTSDTLARWSGEQFMILLPETPLAQAAALAESLRVRLRSLPLTEPRPLTASFGVVEYRPEETVDDCLKRLDDLLAEAKEAGRDRVAGLATASH